MRIEPEQIRVVCQQLRDWGEEVPPSLEEDLVAEFDRRAPDPIVLANSFHDKMPISEARVLLKKKIENGIDCPVCDQRAQVYRRKIHAGMARTLVAMYREGQRAPVYLPDIPQKSRDSSYLALWGLIEEEGVRRDDGGRAGWWRVTEKGERWLKNETWVHKYAYVYDGAVLWHEGVPWTIRDALPTFFNFRELMDGA